MRGPQPAEEVRIPHSTTIRTGDPLEARTRTEQLLGCSHRMAVVQRTRPFLAHVQHRSLNELGLMSSRYGAPVEITCHPPINAVSVISVLGGKMLVHDGGRTAVVDSGQGAVFCYDEDLTMRWTPGLRQSMLTISKPLVLDYLRTLLDAPLDRPLRFTAGVDLAGIGPAVSTLLKALELCGKAGPPPVLAAEIQHAILSGLLLGQRHNYTDAVFSTPVLPAPRVVRRVVDLIESTPTTGLTVADLASFAGISARSLHAAFRKQFGTSPMSYVRRRRLEHARDELLRLDPSAGVKVIDVALRHGFTHTGRFAAAYRARFGESPSTTLRR